MRDLVTTCVEVAGFACVDAGAFLGLGIAVGLVVTGLTLIALGYLIGRG